MSYIALRDFDGFKKGDSIPEEIVQDRLIRGKKIGLADGSKPAEIIKEVPEIKEELITEVLEVAEAVQEKDEILLEDSSAVTVEIKEEIDPEIPEVVTKTKKSKK